MKRYRVFSALFAALVLLTAALPACAQDYPASLIRIVVAFPPGGPTDFVARLLADKLKTLLGQGVIIENKPGANAAIGADYVAKAKPDGYTLFFTTSGAVVINPHMRPDLPYDPVRDFAPVSLLVNTMEVLVVKADSPIKSVPDLVALARSNPQGIVMASTGVGSPPHLALELIKGATGANIVHVPYRGAAQAVTDVIGGQVLAMLAAVSAKNTRPHLDELLARLEADLPVLIPQIRGGTLRAIGVGSRSRAPILPDVPTLDEQGVPGVYADNWYALFAPAKTPAPVIAKLNAAIATALADPELARRLNDVGAVPAAGTPGELADFLKSELDRWGKVIREHNIKPEG